MELGSPTLYNIMLHSNRTDLSLSPSQTCRILEAGGGSEGAPTPVPLAVCTQLVTAVTHLLPYYDPEAPATLCKEELSLEGQAAACSACRAVSLLLPAAFQAFKSCIARQAQQVQQQQRGGRGLVRRDAAGAGAVPPTTKVQFAGDARAEAACHACCAAVARSMSGISALGPQSLRLVLLACCTAILNTTHCTTLLHPTPTKHGKSDW